jgi:hypothetical protein
MADILLLVIVSHVVKVQSSGENLSPIPIYGGNGNGTEIFKDGTEWD